VLLEPDHDVKPGQFLAAWHGRRNSDILTVLQVGNCVEINPNEEPQLAAARERLGLSPGYAGEGVSTRIYRLATSATIEEFEVTRSADGAEPKLARTPSPAALARAGDPVVLLPPVLSQAAIGGLPDPDSGVHLGRAYGAQDFDVTLVPQIFQMHIGVFGNPGKGKSYASGVMLEEARAWDLPVLALDVNGEFTDAARALKGMVITLPDAKQFGLSLALLTPGELISITPNAQPNTQYAELIGLAHDQLRGEARGKEITFNDLITRIEYLGENMKLVRTSIGAAVSRLRELERDPLIAKGVSFDFIKSLTQHRLVVLDCRYLTLRQTQLIAAAAARTLQRYGREMTQKANAGDMEAGGWFSLLFVDEAHAVAPNSEDVVSTQVLYELARMGRHVRTGLLMSSQSPADLDRSILKRLQTRFIFALERDQLSAIGGISADLGEDLLRHLPKLPRGVCAVSGTSELIRHGFLLSVKQRRTPIGGKTPSVFQHREKKMLD
jgi:DNA helicase HerA-like ATPase